MLLFSIDLIKSKTRFVSWFWGCRWPYMSIWTFFLVNFLKLRDFRASKNVAGLTWNRNGNYLTVSRISKLWKSLVECWQTTNNCSIIHLRTRWPSRYFEKYRVRCPRDICWPVPSMRVFLRLPEPSTRIASFCAGDVVCAALCVSFLALLQCSTMRRIAYRWINNIASFFFCSDEGDQPNSCESSLLWCRWVRENCYFAASCSKGRLLSFQLLLKQATNPKRTEPDHPAVW